MLKNYNLFPNFNKKVLSSKSFVATGLTDFLRLLLLKQTLDCKKKIVFITLTEQKALKYQNDLKKLFDIDSKIFPFQETSMYEGIQLNLYEYQEQINLLINKPELILCPIKGLLEKFPSKEFFDTNSILIKKGDNIEPQNIAKKLVSLGYKRVVMVNDIGEFSIRGDIIDIFAMDKFPIRIELWGDEIVDLRFFNNETQKSINKTDSIKILPLYKFTLDNTNKNTPKEILSIIEEEGYFEGIEVYQNYFNDNLINVMDYWQNYTLIFDEAPEIFAKYEYIDENYNKELQEKVKLEIIKNLVGKNHFSIGEFKKSIVSQQKIELNNFIEKEYPEIIEFNATLANNFDANIDKIKNYIEQYKDYKLIIATDYEERVRELLANINIEADEYVENISAHGSVIPECKLILLSDKELFNKRSKEITNSKKRYYKEKSDYIENINDIKAGDYVVHSIHGVGMYIGLTKQEINGQLKDYLTIEYASKDKLHIPAEQINLLCRYRGAGAIKPKLSRMGGHDWENTKTRVKKEVESVAYDLLRLYAKRKMQKGIAFKADTTWQVEMEEAFEYTETPDQMKVIEEVKRDMEIEKPMDRLICGDVGFGKTEVAMRALFKAVMSGKQAAVIVPTTILANQHFQAIEERFKPFAINVELLSRFRSTKEQKQTIARLATGECDVIVATHKLLQKDINFKDLGLLVIDEEHRFGVKHKEKLKRLKENIDIISMSATPIPRTLYMSLSGIKDISIINTPPKNRLPIKTFVGEINEQTIKNAIIHELDRDGQVFYLYNRVETINEFKQKLQKIVPNAKIAVGHAKLDKNELEQVMADFANKEYDILLSTTIIESGLDIPNANTIIIHEADKLGLAQLYQLRGRVGRAERQAYCYCLYKKTKELTKEAVQRLKAIKEFSTLGSGYRIAMQDFEIRGVGNLLGTKQHGHMVTVGFDTYCQLLEETIEELQGEVVEKIKPTIVDINVTAYIPDEWVGSTEQKMIEYKKLADVKNLSELEYIKELWKDRFSKAPNSVENLLKLIKLRLHATEAKIIAIRETSDNIRIYSPYSIAEWKIIERNLPKNITKYLRITTAPKGCSEWNSIVLLNNFMLNFDEVVNILTDLFYYVNKISYEYLNNTNKGDNE